MAVLVMITMIVSAIKKAGLITNAVYTNKYCNSVLPLELVVKGRMDTETIQT